MWFYRQKLYKMLNIFNSSFHTWALNKLLSVIDAGENSCMDPAIQAFLVHSEQLKIIWMHLVDFRRTTTQLTGHLANYGNSVSPIGLSLFKGSNM